MTVCLVMATIIYSKLYISNRGRIRTQALIMLIASICPWLGYYPQVVNHSPWGLDVTPVAASLSTLLFMTGLFRYQFLNIKPLARDQVFEAAGEGL